MRDAIVVGLGPAGAATATMLREPGAFRIAGEALDVLALEARGAVPLRSRTVGLQNEAQDLLGQADSLLGRSPGDWNVGTIGRVERTWRDALAAVGVEARYDTRIANVEDRGRAGVLVTLEDGSTVRGRRLVDASGGRLGTFRWEAPQGETVYLTGQLPPIEGEQRYFQSRTSVRVHGAGNDRSVSPVFGFNDAADGATAFVQFPSLPKGAEDARAAQRLLRRYLLEAGFDPRGLENVSYVVTPHVRVPNAANGNLIAVGDTVRRLPPRTARGVSNALADARGAAWAIHDAASGRVPVERAFGDYALAAGRR